MNTRATAAIRAASAHQPGIVLAAMTALISGVSVWVNAFGVTQVPDAILYTTLKNAVATAVLLVLLLVFRVRTPDRSDGRTGMVERAGFARLNVRELGGLVLVGVFGGGVAFVLFFSGLALATAASAAFIQKTLVIWVALLAVPLLGERLGRVQVAALGVLLLGQILLAPPRPFGWGTGETMIIAATLIWAGEVIVARRLLRSISSTTLGAARIGIGLVVLIAALLFGGHAGGIGSIGPSGWAVVALTGCLLAAYVAIWFAALQRAPASVVTSVLVGGAIVTAALQALAAGRAPDPAAIAGACLVAVALTVAVRLAMRPSVEAGPPVRRAIRA